MASFAFLPRRVANKAKPAVPNTVPGAGPSSSSSSNRHGALPQPAHASKLEPDTPAPTKKRKTDKAELSDEQYAILVELSVSDYALWANPDLRRMADQNAAGYIPLTHLISSSPSLHHLQPLPAQSTLARAVRTHSSETLEVRMLVTAPSSEPWHTARAEVQAPAGGFEVRRKGGPSILSAAEPFTNAFWDARTVYLENVPTAYRSVAGTACFVRELVMATATIATANTPLPDASWMVQHVHLPPHHLDKAGVAPKCKGFALVTLRETDTANLLVQAWPWESRWQPEKSLLLPDHAREVLKEAKKAGLRVLSKARWDALKEEYVAHRAKLLHSMKPGRHQAEDFEANAVAKPVETEPTEDTTTPQQSHTSHQDNIQLFSDSPYPPGCLVFVKHVHPQTNKTTLRSLFVALLVEGTAPDAIDYVDYTKGMDTCHLRLANPTTAEALVAHFATRAIAQKDALDATGSTLSELSTDAHAIAAELVRGMRESVYWERVPEKVRRQAVLRALGPAAGSGPGGELEDGGQQKEGGGRRKRRRK